MEQRLVAKKDILHLVKKVQHWVSVFEDELSTVLFGNMDELELNQIIDCFRDTLGLFKSDATLLARYFFEPRNLTKLKPLNTRKAKASIIEYKLRKFAGSYEKYYDKNIDLVTYDYHRHKDETDKEDFVEDLLKLWKFEFITQIDIASLVCQYGFKIDLQVLLRLLLRKSRSLTEIKASVVTDYLIPQLRSKMKIPKVIITDKTHTIKQPVNQEKNKLLNELTKEVLTENMVKKDPETFKKMNDVFKEALFQLGDSLFTQNKTLSDLTNDMVYDRVIDGKEYQLIKRNDLFECFGENVAQKEVLKSILRPIFQDYVDIKTVEELLKELGIQEPLPKSNKYMDYEILSGQDIRQFNKIIQHMKDNDIIDVSFMLPTFG